MQAKSIGISKWRPEKKEKARSPAMYTRAFTGSQRTKSSFLLLEFPQNRSFIDSYQAAPNKACPICFYLSSIRGLFGPYSSATVPAKAVPITQPTGPNLPPVLQT